MYCMASITLIGPDICVNICIGSNTVHKASNSTADGSNMQCEESGVKEKFEKNAELRVDSFRDLRCVHQQLISHHCTTLIKAPSPLVVNDLLLV